MTRDILLQIAQVLVTLLLAPLLQGIILQFEERVQRARGPAFSSPTATCGSCSTSSSSCRDAHRGFTGAPVVAFTAC